MTASVYAHARHLACQFDLVRVRRVAFRQKGLHHVYVTDAQLVLPADGTRWGCGNWPSWRLCAAHSTRPRQLSSDTAAEITDQADRARLAGNKREGVNVSVRYLTGHLDQLRYDTALENGWPATGAVEGACRHLIGDRLGITGAEAVLKLRALATKATSIRTGRFEREHQHLYPAPTSTATRSPLDQKLPWKGTAPIEVPVVQGGLGRSPRPLGASFHW